MATRKIIFSLLLITAGGVGYILSPRLSFVSMPVDSHVHARWTGRAYTTSGNQRFRGCGWTDWFLRKSKKVWFRLPDSQIRPDASRIYFYSGRPILHRTVWESLAPSERAKLSPVILWGDEVANGWGKGPDGTNHFLYIWTRWSLLQPGACGHPEKFAVEVGSTLAGLTQGAVDKNGSGGSS